MVEILNYEFDDMCFYVGIFFAIVILGLLWVITPKLGLTPFPLLQRIIISVVIVIVAPIIVDKIGNK